MPKEDITPNVHLEDAAYEECSIKTLGTTWNPNSDNLCCTTQTSKKEIITRRDVVSEIFKIFDPLGLFTPVVIKAKIVMQELTRQGYQYDEELPQPLQKKWKQYR